MNEHERTPENKAEAPTARDRLRRAYAEGTRRDSATETSRRMNEELGRALLRQARREERG